MVSIKDNGIGIKKSDYNNIFNLFYTTGNRNENSGIGLRSVDVIVTAHNGYIGVESEYGEYAQFSVALPLIKHKSKNRRGNTL